MHIEDMLAQGKRALVALPRTHVAALIATVLVTFATYASIGWGDVRPTDGTHPGHLARAAVITADQAHRPLGSLGSPPDITPSVAYESHWKSTIVGSGDSLARIFQKHRLSATALHDIVSTSEHGLALQRIHPGHRLAWIVDSRGNLTRLRFHPDALQTVEFSRTKDEWKSQVHARPPEIVVAHRGATINDSLFLASQTAGIEDELTLRLAGIFQWDIDFVLDIRKGDAFRVMYEEIWIDGRKIGNGRILAAEFINRGKAHRAVSYVDSDGVAGYYSEDGRAMKKAFLRAPLEFSRISSNFNPRRRHPLHNTIMPHRGIDYSAPTGTPIYAAGDGRVVAAHRTAANGNFVVVQHPGKIQTKYLHMSRFGKGIRSGKHVSQSDVIGYVGATGWATGPHLHYEFVVDGKHMDPKTVPLPKATAIAGSERRRFDDQTAPLLAKLQSAPGPQTAGTQLALRNPVGQ